MKADTIILHGTYGFTGTTMPDLANSTVGGGAAALREDAEAATVRQAFVDRGILHVANQSSVK